MSIPPPAIPPAGTSELEAAGSALAEGLEALARDYGNRFLLEPAPDNELPEHGMRSVDAMRLIGEELVLDGIPHAQPGDVRDDVDGARGAADHRREPAPQLHRPRRVSADGGDRAALHPHARRPVPRPGRDDRRAHAGLVGGDHARRAVAEVEVARAPRGGRQGHDAAEPRLRRRRARRVGEVLPLLRRRAADHPAAARQVHDRPRGRRAARRREHDRRRRRARARRSPATPTTSSASTTCWSACATRRASTSRCTSTGPAAASCGRSCTPTPRGTSGSSRCARSTSRATSSGSSTRASAGSIFRERSDLAEDLVFYENYLGKTDATFTLNFSTGSAMVLAQYYNFVRFGHDGYRYIMETMQANTRAPGQADRRHRRRSSWSASPAPSSCRSSPSSSRRSTTTTSSTSPRSWPPSAAGWCPPTRCRRTPTTSRSCARWSS